VVKEGSLTQRRSENGPKKEEKSEEYDDFRDGHREISSIIHSNSVFKEFHNSAEKIFNAGKKES
jgi:hypothetical protein